MAIQNRRQPFNSWATSPSPAVAMDLGATSPFCYIKNFLHNTLASRLLEIFDTELYWQQQEIKLFGRKISQPRLSCWYGDMGVQYAYSGLQLQPLPWHDGLSELRFLLQDTLQHPFNSVLANAYRDGRDSMGWHADDEKELGVEPFIASVSLGATRRFLVRPRGLGESICLLLEHGSLLVMQRESQSTYRHSVPRTARPVGLRINLTFRQVMN